MIRIAICDDDTMILQQTTNVLLECKESLHLDVSIEPFHTGKSLLSAIENKENYDIIYMDIEMEGINGIDTAKYFRKHEMNVILIFISNYEKYLMELFEVEPFRFIKKPIDEGLFKEIFLKAVHKVIKQNNLFEYSVKKTIMKVYYKDIVYFESAQRKIILHQREKNDIFYGKLNIIENDLRNKTLLFIRVHQSFLVNYNFIKSFGNKQVQMFNGDIINISEDRQKNSRVHYFNLLNSDIFK